MPPNAGRPKLSVVIPAYNEEEGIALIIERTLSAREAINAACDLSGVEVIVVDDGSSDRTGEIAASYSEIRLITYQKNRGYGAAIKQGFDAATGDLLAFLDADGTCDPRFFETLTEALLREDADVAIGSRLGDESEMPAIRRLGNRLFAGIITLWGGTRVTDSASGMRVMRRSSLSRLYPLPDGMHFTPAMSAVAIFDPHLHLVEVPMRYRERTGESKLRVLADGLRFLRVIIDTALTYRPLRPFGVLGSVLLGLAVGYGILPVVFYLQHRHLEEWMIYRLVAVVVGLTVGVNLLAVGVLGQQMVALIHDHLEPASSRRLINRVLLDYLVPWGTLSVLAGVALNARSVWEYATTGHVTAHWSYVLTGGLLVTLGVEFVSFGVMARVLNVIRYRRMSQVTADPPGGAGPPEPRRLSASRSRW
jgi:glycosyltransferase involved in cell wall biosynthesis